MLVSKETGFCEAIIHGQIPTRIRTAAASAVATRHLARPDSRVLGLIGAGDLAVEHVRALTHVRPFERVVFWTRNPETAARFAARIAEAHPQPRRRRDGLAARGLRGRRRGLHPDPVARAGRRGRLV